MTIDATHGIVENADNSLFAHRNLLDADKFTHHLKTRRKPYQPLRSVLSGEGDALTLDDSTFAAANAARMARMLGHDVTFFVNGFHIAKGRSYFFSRLHAALDRTNASRVRFNWSTWNLSERSGKERFRAAVKKRLISIGDEDARDEFVSHIIHLMGQEEFPVPEHLRTITESELEELQNLGVDIQNHGWTHARVGSLSPKSHAEDIRQGREWLRSVFKIDAEFYAVPNGDGLPSRSSIQQCSAWFLLDDSRPYGEVSPKVYGRRTLELS